MELSEVSGHVDRRVVADLFIPLADSAFYRAAGDRIVQTTVAVTFAVQGFSLFLPRFSIAETSSTDVHSIRVSGCLEEACGSLVTS